MLIGGIIGILIALALIGYGIKGGTLWVEKDGARAPVSGSPNWLMIILGVIIGVSSIVALVNAK